MKQFQLSKSNALYNDINWIGQSVDYKKLSLPELHTENAKILKTLKVIEHKISKQLETKHRNKNYSSRVKQSTNVQALEQKIKNNQKLIGSLTKDYQQAENRRQKINQGLQSKTIQLKFGLERTIAKTKNQIKQLKNQQKNTKKRLVEHGDLSRPENMKENQRLEEELRVYSIKYVRLLDKYNKSTQKLALASQVELPDIDIPQDIYDQELEERQQAQYKQYEGIVKLCQVLSHRNDSQHNKSHRQYTAKLKDLQKIIVKLGQLDQAITSREADLIQSKKNIQLIKMKLQNSQSYDTKAMILSQSSLPRGKSHSTVKLPPHNSHNKLRSRGYSMVKLKAQ